jgi:hypothetical protein
MAEAAFPSIIRAGFLAEVGGGVLYETQAPQSEVSFLQTMVRP